MNKGTYVQFHLLLDLLVELFLLVDFRFFFLVQLIFIILDLVLVIFQMASFVLVFFLEILLISLKCLFKCGTLERVVILHDSEVILWLDILGVKELLYCSCSTT